MDPIKKILRDVLKNKGVANDIAKALERQTKKLSDKDEMEARMAAQKIALEVAREVFKNQPPPVPKKKTIIMPD